MFRYIYILLIISLFFINHVNATHVMGGELTYRYMGSNQYEITLKLYRNCSAGAATAPNTAQIRVKSNSTTIINPFLPKVSLINITDSIASDPCMIVPPNVCVEEYIYRDIFTLPAVPAGGYHITYSLRNRNWSISNVTNPGTIDMILYEKIPDPSLAVNNNSPTFTYFPPTFICVNQSFVFNHSATDIDGDSLYYELYHPYGAPDGNYGNTNNFNPTIIAGVPVIPNIPWNGPYNAFDPMGGVPLTIDQNGILRATPNLIGQYVVGIMVSEYRNGVLIGKHLKDFQFNVVDCQTIKARIKTGFGALIACDNTVTFPNKSIGASNFFWDFGDPSTTADTSSAINPSYTYSSTGTYTVTLVAQPGTSCADTVQSDIQIRPPINTNFTVNDVCYGYPALFKDITTTSDGTFIVLRQWDFGDGNFSTQPNPSHLYDSVGIYNVTLIVTANLGCVDTLIKSVEVKQGPTANFSVDTTAGCEPFTVLFSDSSINADQYFWDLGDGTLSNSNASNFTHTYFGSNEFLVKLITTYTPTGCTDTATLNIINYNNPKAEFDVSNPIGCSPLTVIFDNQSLRAASYQWDFGWDLGNGDQSNDSIPPPIVYTNSGMTDSIYVVTLIATSTFGCAADTAYDSITVKPQPTSTYMPSDTICWGDEIYIDDILPDPTATYLWQPNIGLDNNTIANPTASPQSSINYYLIRYTYQATCIDTSYKYIKVNKLPKAIAWPDTQVCRGEIIQLFASGGAYYYWVPTELLTATNISNPITIPLMKPENNFTVYVTDTNGCQSFANVTVKTTYPYLDAGKDKIILKGESTQLDATADPASIFSWTPRYSLSDSDIEDPIASPANTTTYIINIELNGCYNTDTVIVKVIDLAIDVPSAFSPDNDGYNDIIYLEGRDINKLEFRIFDRWGKIVFETNDKSIGWDGKYLGKSLDMDTYVYYAIAESELNTTIVKKGNITLLR